MTIVKVPDHVAAAQALLPQQFRGRDAIEALVAVVAGPANEIETTLIDMQAERRDIDAAGGVQLTLIGDMLGVPRGGRSDSDLRVAIREEIALHNSDGTRDTLIELCGNFIAIVENDAFPAEFQVFDRDPSDGTIHEHKTYGIDEALRYARLINKGRPAGVYFTFEAITDGGSAFAFDGAGGATFDGPSVWTITTYSAT